MNQEGNNQRNVGCSRDGVRLESCRPYVFNPIHFMVDEYLTFHRYNRYLAIAARVVRRSLKDDLRLQAEKRGDMDLRVAKWEVRLIHRITDIQELTRLSEWQTRGKQKRCGCNSWRSDRAISMICSVVLFFSQNNSMISAGINMWINFHV